MLSVLSDGIIWVEGSEIGDTNAIDTKRPYMIEKNIDVSVIADFGFANADRAVLSNINMFRFSQIRNPKSAIRNPKLHQLWCDELD
jgi:hypothetical protein